MTYLDIDWRWSIVVFGLGVLYSFLRTQGMDLEAIIF